MRRWVTVLGAGEVSAGGNIQPASAAGLQTYSRLRCPPPPLREVHGTSSAADPRPRALPRARPRPLPWQPMARERGHVCCLRIGALSAPAASRPRFLCKREVLTPAGTCFFCPACRGESLLATSKHETAEPCRPASGQRGIRAARGAEEDSDENCGIRWASNWHTLLPPAPGTAVEQDRGGRAWLCPSPSRAGPILGIHQEDKEPGRQAGVPGQPPAVPRPAAPSSDPHLPPAKGYSSAQTCSLQAIGSNCFQHQI